MTFTLSRRLTLTGFTAAGFALARPHIARAAVRTVRLGHSQPDKASFDQSAVAVAEAVAANPILSEVLSVKISGNAAMGDEVNILKGVVNSTVDLAMLANVSIGGLAPAAALLNAPFVFGSAQQARASLDGPLGIEFAAMLHGAGINVLAWGENGMRHVTANRPIRTPSDLHGLKIRVPQSDIIAAGFKALGAEAAPLSAALLREALRTGQFDGQENSLQVIESFKLHEFHKYLSLTGHIYDPAVIVACGDLLEDLTPAQREALMACASKGAAISRRLADDAQAEGLKRLAAHGMTIVTDVDAGAFKAAIAPFMQTLSTKYDGALVKQLLPVGA